MHQLYYENPYQKEFTAEIINVIEKDNKYHVELDKTYFYPSSKDQPNDIGYINSVPVSYAYQHEGKIYHVIDVKPLKIHKVKCSIDWEKRYDYMQQHLGQHIISACASKLYSANTLLSHIGEEHSYIDIDKTIGHDDIKSLERTANEIVLDNAYVEILYPTKAELKKLSIRKTCKNPEEQIRIVKIGDIDITPCDGIHLNSTIQVQIIKIAKWSKHGNGTRIEFICGSKAVSDYFIKHDSMEKMSALLRCNISDVVDIVADLQSELNKVTTEKQSLKLEVAKYEVQNMLNSCDTVDNIRILKCIYDNADLKYINLLAAKLVCFPNVIVLFGVISKDKTQLIFMRSKDLNIIKMNELLKDAITLIDGNGGGNDFSAQGGGKNNNNLDSSMEYAYRKVKDSIIAKSKS